MRRGFQGVALRQFTRLFESGTLSAASDRELLDEFARRRDDAAFEVLLTRYGRLVLNLGRKLLHDPRDVEDAFQATFLVLVRKPPRLRVGESLGPWMSTVAYRVAARARANRIRLNKMETADGLEAVALTDSDTNLNALALHEELNRLPERLRRPVVCCYLEGLTHERAAERLGCPVGTVRSRLARARSLLHRRLSIRGVAPSIAPLEVLFYSNSIEPPLRLIDQTMRLVASSHVRWPEAAVASASLLSLVNGVVRMMNLKKALVALSLALPLGGVVAVGGAQAYQKAADVKQDVGSPRSQVVQTIEKTYPVGNLYAFRNYQVEQPDVYPGISLEMATEGGRPDLAPLVEMIRSCIAPGTWKTDDADAGIGSVAPTANGYYLVVRHTSKVQEQVAALLANLRKIVNAAIWNAIDQVAPGTSKASIYVKLPSMPKDDTQVKGEAPRGGNESQSERRKRVRQLLQQLQTELDAMDPEGAATTPPQNIP